MSAENARRPCGITSARTGSTSAMTGGSTSRPDHPRAYGEYAANSGGLLGNNGSPPRMRGALDLEQTAAESVRVTPARTGSTPGSAGCC